jgi:sialate O-acetylesterase
MRNRTLLISGLLFAFNMATAEEPKLPSVRPFLHPLFTEHAVLQREAKVPVWGWVEPGAKVTVSFAGQNKIATAGQDGKWMAYLDPMPVNTNAQTMTVSSSIGNLKSEIKNLLLGDVWICSGQSNMEMGMGMCNVSNEIAAADYPGIRLMIIPKVFVCKPEGTFDGSWKVCSPKSILEGGWGGFSAAGYFFGRELHRELNVPIGLIESSWGGTVCEAWTSREALAPLADFKSGLGMLDKLIALQDAGQTGAAMEKMFKTRDPGTALEWFKPETDVSTWEPVNLPANWGECGMPGYEGIVWVQRTFEAPAEWAGMGLVLNLGNIGDIDTTWVNGTVVGRTDYYGPERNYKVPSPVVRAGRNVITVRVMNAGGGGFFGKPEEMKIFVQGKESSAISIAGPWRIQDTATLGTTGPLASGSQNDCSVLYNGMIAPLIPFAIKGAVWYQGESNAKRADQYRTLLPNMIKDWRSRFASGDFGFHIVSLANYEGTSPEPVDNNWAELREAQAMTAKALPNCGIAMAIDIGDAGDIHPKNKLDVGRRLALSALANTYGKRIEWSGPWYSSMKIKNGAVRLYFDHAKSGLVAKGGKLTGFAIAGKDRNFVWADAVIDGKTVVVSSPSVSDPVAVRYGWDSNPVCNLYNKDNLPAVPFRTDDWPGVTINVKTEPAGKAPSLAISKQALAIEGDLGQFKASWSVKRPERNLMLATLTLTAPQATTPPPLTVTWHFPAIGIAGVWVSDFNKPNFGHRGVTVESRAVMRAPVIQLLSPDDRNRMTVALSDALRPTRLRLNIVEEDMNMSGRAKLFEGKHPPLKDYSITFRFDSRPRVYTEVLRDTARWWAAQDNYKPAPVPDGARVPLYSTWYNYHQSIDPATIINECRLGGELGLGGVIVDDGWQTLDSSRGYAFTGDWKPERIPEMKKFVDDIHALNQKFMLWYSVPMAGEKSEAAKRFEGKFLGFSASLKAHILDPRYPEVRDYLIGIYEKAVREWGIDGLKLDFIEMFGPKADTVLTAENGRDYASVDEAVDRLFTDIMTRLRAIKPDITIEFRQPYNGPLMRKYGNMFRGVDCPNAGPANRKETLDLRLLADNTAVHSDMFVWHPDESVDRAALQILDVLFSVPQLSVRLSEVSAEHRSMIGFWLRYWKENRSVLLDGELLPVSPASNYPLVIARTKNKFIAAVYQDMVITPGTNLPVSIDVVNAKPGEPVAVRFDREFGNATVKTIDCMGRKVSEQTQLIGKGLNSWNVPPSGVLEIRKK